MSQRLMRRIETLEARATQEAAAAAAHDGLPDVATIDLGHLFGLVILGMRSGVMQDGRTRTIGRALTLWTWPMVGHTAHRQEFDPTCRACVVGRFWEEVAERAETVVREDGSAFVALFNEEIIEAIRVIDAGGARVAPLFTSPTPGVRGSLYQLRLIDAEADPASRELFHHVNSAVALWAHQVELPQVGDWEMTTVQEWRAWLAECLSERQQTEEVNHA